MAGGRRRRRLRRRWWSAGKAGGRWRCAPGGEGGVGLPAPRKGVGLCAPLLSRGHESRRRRRGDRFESVAATAEAMRRVFSAGPFLLLARNGEAEARTPCAPCGGRLDFGGGELSGGEARVVGGLVGRRASVKGSDAGPRRPRLSDAARAAARAAAIMSGCCAVRGRGAAARHGHGFRRRPVDLIVGLRWGESGIVLRRLSGERSHTRMRGRAAKGSSKAAPGENASRR